MNVKDTLLEIQQLKQRNAELEAQNEFLENKCKNLRKKYDDFYEKEYLKRIDECNELWGKLFDVEHMSVWEFAQKYHPDYDLRKEFAKSLLGGA